jgi:hypothetical protein
MPMSQARGWQICCVCLLVGGCTTIPPCGEPDVLVDAIFLQAARDKVGSLTPLNPETVYNEIPRQTPLELARSVMEHHGFKCITGVNDSKGTCVWCTACKREEDGSASRVVVKLFTDNDLVVDVEVTIERHAWGLYFK